LNFWRLTTRSTEEEAFNGQGASKYGGRWNSKGTKMVYCSDSVSLAVLENLVHFDVDIAPPLYLYEIEIEHKNIFSDPATTSLLKDESRSKAYGDKWVSSNKTVALKVASAVVANESNYLLSPEHTDFKKLNIVFHGLFDLDARLKK